MYRIVDSLFNFRKSRRRLPDVIVVVRA